MEATAQLVLTGVISLLLLYVGLVMRQFSNSVKRLESAIDSLLERMGDSRERLARLEALIEETRTGGA
jgi:hypothetical protein